jgi:hypothetical protein
VDAPSVRHRNVPASAIKARSKEEPMSDVRVLAIDLAKRAPSPHVVDPYGHIYEISVKIRDFL